MGLFKKRPKVRSSIRFTEHGNDVGVQKSWRDDATVEGVAYFEVSDETPIERFMVFLSGTSKGFYRMRTGTKHYRHRHDAYERDSSRVAAARLANR